jgi:hypothetical protein
VTGGRAYNLPKNTHPEARAVAKSVNVVEQAARPANHCEHLDEVFADIEELASSSGTRLQAGAAAESTAPDDDALSTFPPDSRRYPSESSRVTHPIGSDGPEG